MPQVDRARVLKRFKEDGRNSSHFVWLEAELEFYECANGWLFAYKRLGEVTLLALEPLVPGAPEKYGEREAAAFAEAWIELCGAASIEVAAFVSVYEPFVELLRKSGFGCLKVGQEPWVELA